MQLCTTETEIKKIKMNTEEGIPQDQSRLKLNSFNSAGNLHFDRFLHFVYLNPLPHFGLVLYTQKSKTLNKKKTESN